MIKHLAVTVALVVVASCCQLQAFDFVPGHFYATHYFSSSITQYDSGGAVVDSLNLPILGPDFRGLAFGPDGLLYVTSNRALSGYTVYALNAAGQVQQQYSSPSWISGNISLGKIAFDQTGHFYVGGMYGIEQFEIGKPDSATKISDRDTYDLNVLPGGNLLVMQNYKLVELDQAGSLVWEIFSFTDGRGVQYDAQNDVIFSSWLGHSGASFQIIKLDADTGAVLDQTDFGHADDLWLTPDNRLVAGSRTLAPGVFTTDLDQIGSFGGTEKMFVTQFVPVPEPSTLVLLGIGAGGLLAYCWQRRRSIKGR